MQHVLEDVLLAAELEQVAQRVVVLQAEAAGLADGEQRGAQRVGGELAARAAAQPQRRAARQPQRAVLARRRRLPLG